MKLPYVVRMWAETHSRATYLITDPRIIYFKQHLSFLLPPLFLSLFSGGWDKQANMHADHKPLSWSPACLLCMLTKITIYQVCVLFCLAAYGLVSPVYDQMWFTSPGPTAVCVLKFSWMSICLQGFVLLSTVMQSLTKEPREQQLTATPNSYTDKNWLAKQTGSWHSLLDSGIRNPLTGGNILKPGWN